MKCLQCGTKMTTRKENHSYRESGLPGVTLLDVEVSRCPDCGEFEVAIPRIEELHRTIARVIIRKNGKLSPPEIRYLRKYLGFSGVDCAAHMGVQPETVSRWESGDQPIGSSADRLLRFLVGTRPPRADYSMEHLKGIESKTSPPSRFKIRIHRGKWEMMAA